MQINAKGSRASFFLILLGGLALCGQARAQADAPLILKMSGSLDVGVLRHALTTGYSDWNGQFVRGVLRTDASNVWNAELVHSSQFDDSGTLLVVGNTHDFNDQWYSSVSVSGSSGGFFLPRLRLDAAINRKWLEKLNLITTIGVTAVEAKDGHQDRSLLLAASYYFDSPWVLEGGIRFNRSNPGQVLSNAKYIAATYGEDKRRIVSLRYGFGEEAYQLISENAELSNFNSSVWTLTWREWLRKNQGFQLRAESYRNPSYDRYGIEFSLFQEF